MVTSLVLPMILMKEPLDKLFLTFKLLIDKEFPNSFESNKIIDVSSLSPTHDILSASKLLIYVSL